MFSFISKQKRVKIDSILKLSNYNDNETLQLALKDAEALMLKNGAASSFDRWHTLMHSYFMYICKKENILFNPTTSLINLLKLIYKMHPTFNDSNPKSLLFHHMSGNINSLIEILTKLRNSHSLVHPTSDMLSESEAILGISLIRDIIIYFDNKLSENNASLVEKRCVNCRNFVEK